MRSEIKIFRYSLNFEHSPNAKTPPGPIDGALLRIGKGHGCIQPWPTLNDESLQFHLDSILTDFPTSLALACKKCCEIDGFARENKLDLFESVKIPESHYTFNPFGRGKSSEPDLLKAKNARFTKLKGTNDLDSTIRMIEIIAMHSLIRVDFNSSLTETEYRKFANSLSKQARESIDFIEDPVPYDDELWTDLSSSAGLRLALDRGPKNATKGFAVRVWKPCCETEPPSQIPICVTHNMDHELGRRYAAHRAVNLQNALEVCGVGDFDSTKNGFGLGMDEQLKALDWEDLY